MIPGLALVDLSVDLGPNPSEHVPVNIQRYSHEEGGRYLAALVEGKLEDLEDGCGWASERVEAITHAGTHVDAPYHCTPVIQGNARPPRTIDEIPLEWFFGPAVRIDVAGGNGVRVAPDEVVRWEARERRAIGDGDLVLFRTGAAPAYGTAGYSRQGRSLHPETVALLHSRGVRVIGTDAWSIDPHYDVMRIEARDRAGLVWAAHKHAKYGEFCVVEKLCNLERVPPHGFWMACFPVKVRGGSAGWTRAVAFVPRGDVVDGAD